MVKLIKELEAELGFQFLAQLTPINEKIAAAATKQCIRREAQKNETVLRQKWFGALYGKEIDAAVLPLISIKWVSSFIGYGVFAEQEIVPYTFVGEYTGFLRRRTFISNRQSNYCFDYPLGQWGRSSFLIDAEQGGNHTRFINHSDKPNLEPVGVLWNHLLHIVLRSTVYIPKGTELTYDYGSDYWKRRVKI